MEAVRVVTPWWIKPLLFLVLLATMAGVYVATGDRLELRRWVAHESTLRRAVAEHPVATTAGAFTVYVTVTSLSVPGATAMTLVLGWLFGFWRAVVLVSFASTAGATLAMLVSRFLLRDAVKRMLGERATAIDRAWATEGMPFLFMMRLIPAVPFFVINIAMGLTPIRARTFWWVSQLGMLPGTIVYVYAASSVPDLATLSEQGARGLMTPRVIGAFVLLATFPWLVRWLFHRRRRP